MKSVPFVSIILENAAGQVLLLLRKNHSTTYSNHWTLVGGKVNDTETPEVAAQRILEEEIGIQLRLSFWKSYQREHPLFIVDQYVYTGKIDSSCELLVLGHDTQFFKPDEIGRLKIGYGFDALLNEYFQLQER